MQKYLNSSKKTSSGSTPSSPIETVNVKQLYIGPGQPLAFFCGVCVMESEEHTLFCASELQKIFRGFPFSFIFKASYDKANRTSVKSFRGPGLKEGIGILGRLARDTGLPVLTDVHEPSHCEIAAEAVDVLRDVAPRFVAREENALALSPFNELADGLGLLDYGLELVVLRVLC